MAPVTTPTVFAPLEDLMLTLTPKKKFFLQLLPHTLDR